MRSMFNLKKVKKARRRLKFIGDILFKLFQLNLRYKENRKDYGLEIYEYFYLPWKSDTEFNEIYSLISDYTLNPPSRLYTIYDLSKKYLLPNSTFIEVGCWKGGVTGLVALANKNKSIDYFACDTFTGVTKTSDKDTFFKGNEYNDANIEDLIEVGKISNEEFKIIKGIFPESIDKNILTKPITFAHIDVDTYLSAKESFEFIDKNSGKGALIILDDYGGWFSDGATEFGNEIKYMDEYFVAPNHLGQLLIYKV